MWLLILVLAAAAVLFMTMRGNRSGHRRAPRRRADRSDYTYYETSTAYGGGGDSGDRSDFGGSGDSGSGGGGDSGGGGGDSGGGGGGD